MRLTEPQAWRHAAKFSLVHRHIGVTLTFVQLQRGMTMSVESHLSELERRHRKLEREIREYELHPGEDSLRIAELKRKKLRLKQEITRVQEKAGNRPADTRQMH